MYNISQIDGVDVDVLNLWYIPLFCLQPRSITATFENSISPFLLLFTSTPIHIQNVSPLLPLPQNRGHPPPSSSPTPRKNHLSSGHNHIHPITRQTANNQSAHLPSTREHPKSKSKSKTRINQFPRKRVHNPRARQRRRLLSRNQPSHSPHSPRHPIPTIPRTPLPSSNQRHSRRRKLGAKPTRNIRREPSLNLGVQRRR